MVGTAKLHLQRPKSQRGAIDSAVGHTHRTKSDLPVSPVHLESGITPRIIGSKRLLTNPDELDNVPDDQQLRVLDGVRVPLHLFSSPSGRGGRGSTRFGSGHMS